MQCGREFLVDVEATWKQVLAQEDTDGDCKITVLDQGPKVRPARTATAATGRRHARRPRLTLAARARAAGGRGGGGANARC